VCNARYPASTALATIVPGDPMQDAVWKALAKAMPDRVSAGFGRINCVPFFSGKDQRDTDERDWGCMLFNGAAGGGAAPHADGWPLVMTLAASGGLKILSVEMTEMLYPVLVERMEIEPESMGHGKHIGGPGINIGVRSIGGPMECHLFGDGASNPPHGVLGGTPGIGGGTYKENRLTNARVYCSAKGHLVIEPDEVWVGVSSGGGGYGDPLERHTEQVLMDVSNGIIRLDTARQVYGVVIDQARMAVDDGATELVRAQIRASRGTLPLVNPQRPGAAVWLDNQMRPGDQFLLDPQ